MDINAFMYGLLAVIVVGGLAGATYAAHLSGEMVKRMQEMYAEEAAAKKLEWD